MGDVGHDFGLQGGVTALGYPRRDRSSGVLTCSDEVLAHGFIGDYGVMFPKTYSL